MPSPGGRRHAIMRIAAIGQCGNGIDDELPQIGAGPIELASYLRGNIIPLVVRPVDVLNSPPESESR